MHTSERQSVAVNVEILPGSMDRRSATRFTCRGEVEGILPQRGSLFRGELTDISKTGFHLATRAPLRVPVESEVVLKLNLRDRFFRTNARVCRAGNGRGMAFTFEHESSITAQVFENLLRELSILADSERKTNPIKAAAAQHVV